jgi:tetratricopeptide (TPR) repeat protein
MARVLAAWCNHYQGRQSVADSITRAMLSRSLPPLEAAMMGLLAAIGKGDMDGQHQAAQSIAGMAVAGEWRYLAVDVALNEGRGREAVRILEDIGPDRGWMRGSFRFWYRMGRALHYLGAHDKELAAAAEARRRFPGNRILSQVYIKALAGLGRVDEVEAEIDRALTLRQKWQWGDWQPMDQAINELLAHGHPEGAKRVAARTMAWLRQQPAAEQEAMDAATPWFLFAAGEIDAARAPLERLIANDPRELEALELLAEIALADGDSAVARRADAQLAAMSDPGLKVDVLVTRAGIAAALGERDRAVAFLRDSFRAGFTWRTVLHIQVGLVRLRGYPPFEQLIGPVE